MFLKIDDRIINTSHIVDVMLDAELHNVFGADPQTYPRSIIITLSATSGEFGHLANNCGSMQNETIEYKTEQADVLRPWLIRALVGEETTENTIALPESAT